jgi:hypothetical protein
MAMVFQLSLQTHPLHKYRDALRVQPKLADQGLRVLREVYAHEDEARDEAFTGARLRAHDQSRSRAVLERYREWLLEVQARELPPSDPVGKVVNDTLNHWDGLTRFVDAPRLPLDHSVSERELQRHTKLR